MPTTTLKQKILLALFSLIFLFLILEGGLRLGGFIFVYLQNQHNKISSTQKEFRILCLGESTTALGGGDSYPAQLEAILNARRPDIKFRVINKGMVSKFSRHILAALDKNMNQYKPDLVVTMIGVNENLAYDNLVNESNVWPKVESFLENFRTYNFFKLLGKHIYYKVKGAPTPDALAKSPDKDDSPPNPGESDKILLDESHAIIRRLSVTQDAYNKVALKLDEEKDPVNQTALKEKLRQLKSKEAWYLYRLGRYHRLRGNYPLAEHFFKSAIAANPKNFAPYYEWGLAYENQGKYDLAVAMLEKAREVNPQSILTYLELGRSYDQLKNDKRVREFYKFIFDRKPPDAWIFAEIGKWFGEHNDFELAEQSYFMAIKRKETPDHFLYAGLADVYRRAGKTKEAEIYAQKAAASDKTAHRYPPVTIRNYNKIVEDIRRKGSKVICMQYPRRDVDKLKNILSAQNDIIFVENKTNFDKVLQHAKYGDIFSDNFASDFGHCTHTGNHLIAENLADTILEKIFKPETTKSKTHPKS